MKYSDLVEALEQGDKGKIDQLLKSLIPRLISYLRIHFNAGRADAEDCAQQALLISLEAVRRGEINDAESIFSFLITTCRNTYLNMMNRQKRQIREDFSSNHSCKPRQLFSLLNNERLKLLEQCLEQLSDGYKIYIEYWFKYPGSGAKAAATYFDISESNAWTRKHRVINKLSECYQQKSNI